MLDENAREARVTTLELFFDLVFVFTVTQLTSHLVGDTTLRGLAQTTVMLGLIWWMYAGYAWLTNAVRPDTAGRALVLLGGMASFLVLALAIPGAFSGSGLAFGLAYLVIVAIHGGLFTRTSSQSVLYAIFRLLPFNLVAACLVIIGGALGGTALYVLWTGAFVFQGFMARRLNWQGWELAPVHFVERHRLVVLIAIGESIIAIGIGASDLPVDLGLVVVAVLGLALSACLWWAYFGGDDVRAEAVLARASSIERTTLAINAYGYCHLLLLLGVIAMAAGIEHALGHPTDQLELGPALALAGGVALFMLGQALFRNTLGIGRSGWCLGASLGALATVPVGTEIGAVHELTALLLVLVLAFKGEHLHSGRTHRHG